jgi:hypothetical protein
MTKRIAMWSGPRNLSTAMMRSFGARADTFVSDEPFYGAYLRESGDIQPMGDAVMASMDCDWAGVAQAMNGPPPEPCAIWYQKHMAHHMEGPASIDDLPGHVHAFLIRDPARVAASYAAKRQAVEPRHLGIAQQRRYFERVADRLGRAPPVIDSADVLADPEGVLRLLCAALEIPWDAGMLHWPPGRRATDGVWAAHWYGAVEQSTGFGGPDNSPGPALDADVAAVAEACRADYEFLAQFRLGSLSESRG